MSNFGEKYSQMQAFLEFESLEFSTNTRGLLSAKHIFSFEVVILVRFGLMEEVTYLVLVAALLYSHF